MLLKLLICAPSRDDATRASANTTIPALSAASLAAIQAHFVGENCGENGGQDLSHVLGRGMSQGVGEQRSAADLCSRVRGESTTRNTYIAAITRGLSDLSARAVEEYVVSSNAVLSRPTAGQAVATAAVVSGYAGRRGHIAAACIPEREVTPLQPPSLNARAAGIPRLPYGEPRYAREGDCKTFVELSALTLAAMRKAGDAQPMGDGNEDVMSVGLSALTLAALSGAGFLTANSGH
jgi:hypothetical protein